MIVTSEKNAAQGPVSANPHEVIYGQALSVMNFSGSLSLNILNNITQTIFERGLSYAKKGFVSELSEESKKLTAIFSLTLDDILKNIDKLNENDLVEIFIESVIFYYQIYLSMIDGSDGVWQIPQARIRKMFGMVAKKLNDEEKIEDIREELNEKIDGWGDIFDDLDVSVNSS